MKALRLLLFPLLLPWTLSAAPVPYAGKLAIDGVNLDGVAAFTFALRDGNGSVHWRNGADANASINVPVDRGHYLVLLGGQGMNPLPANLFLDHLELYLEVRFKRADTGEWLHLQPDQGITSTPHALTAEVARGVLPGAITKSMLAAEVLADLNATVLLPEQNATLAAGSVTLSHLSPGVRADLNGTIARSRLSQDVLADLNRTIVITRDMLPASVLADLNGTITRTRLAADVLSDLNATITRSRLAGDVLADLNRTITKSMLSAEVLADLNATSGPDGNGSSAPAIPAGNLIALSYGQNAPTGYTLHQAGQLKDFVWEQKANVSVARYAGDGVEALDGKLYFVGGWNDSGSLNLAERYDPATNQWQTLAAMSAARTGVAAAVLNGKLYAIGGAGLSSVEIFDPATGQWTAGPALPGLLAYATAITVDGKILLIGGKNAADQNVNQVLELDPGSNQWSQKANMPTARHGMKLALFDGKVWAIGGVAGAQTDVVEIYDPANNSWTSGPSLPIARPWPLAWAFNEKLYAAGGSFLNSINVYDPAGNVWVTAGSLPENKYVADSAILGGKLYLATGQTALSTYSNKLHAADLNATIAGVFDLYRRDGNATSGGSGGSGGAATIAPNSITTSQLSETILKYLKPEITSAPQATNVYQDANATFSVAAEGKYLTYQWKRNGADLPGETNATLNITDANATLHDGNYTVVVSNDFGGVTTIVALLKVKVPPHFVQGASNLEMLWVELGTFTMGSPTNESDRNSDREDEHNVTFTKGFYLGKHEVTQAQYEGVMTGNSNQLSTTPSQFGNNPNRPVEKVSWDDAQVFLTRLNAAEQAAGRLPAGWSYVLPTESEWEYACRAGTKTAYSWGNSIAATNANYWSSGISQTRDVGQYPPNPWGFHDMHGNVWEWTADWFQLAYPSGSVTDPTGPVSGTNRAFRGGSWDFLGMNLRSAKRNSLPSDQRYSYLGFRIAFKKVQ